MTLFFRLLATAVLIASCFFLMREPISLAWVIPITLLILRFSKKMRPNVSPFLIILLCLVSLLWVHSKKPLWGEKYAETQSNEQAIEAAKKEDMQQREFVSKAQYVVKQKLKDPSSASFSSDYVYTYGGSPVVCGSVNAKNSFGAMSGNGRYVSDGTPTGSYIDDGGSDFEEIWKLRCKN